MAMIKANKTKSKKLPKILFAVIVILICAGVGICFYLFGGITRDRSLDSSDLSAMDIRAGLTRGSGDNTDPAKIVGIDESGTSNELTDYAVDDEEILEIIRNFSDKKNTTVSTLLEESEKISVFVLYGIDEGNLSDAIIIAALDPVHHKIKLISIARDTYVYISDRGYSTKINHAYSMGGAALSIKTLNENFYLAIEDYVAVDFEQLETIVDFIGGVRVDLTWAEWKKVGCPADVTPGENVLLNGKQALMYSRIRSIDNDLVRTSRQREVLASMFETAKGIGYSKYPGLIKEAANMCTTSFTNSELLRMSRIMLDDELTLEMYGFPNEESDSWGGLINGTWFFVYDLDKTSDEIYKIIYEDLYISGYES